MYPKNYWLPTPTQAELTITLEGDDKSSKSSKRSSVSSDKSYMRQFDLLKPLSNFKQPHKRSDDDRSMASTTSERSVQMQPLYDDVNVNPAYVPHDGGSTSRPSAGRRIRRQFTELNPLSTPSAKRVPGITLNRKVKVPPHNKSIKAALEETQTTPNAELIVCGFSPTGGGHTPRCLNVLIMGAESGKLPKGSTVILHVPQKWGDKPRPKAVEQFAAHLRGRGINVINLEADKSVLGFLDPKTNASLDGTIVKRFAMMPRREDADVRDVKKGELLPAAHVMDGDGIDTSSETSVPKVSYDRDFPSISAKALFESLEKRLDPKFVANRMRVFTDMAPDLQQAADRIGIPGDRRVDQKNHTIMLNLDDLNSNLVSENAVLSKVLGGFGEQHAHIGLGDRNSLIHMTTTATDLNVTQDSTKKEARTAVAKHLLDKGVDLSDGVSLKKALDSTAPVASSGADKFTWSRAKNALGFNKKDRVAPSPAGAVAGIMKHSSITKPEDVENIVYVYAHANQNRVAKRVHEQIEKADASDAFKNTLFVFAGAALKSPVNVLHAAYLGDADGIATMGAGVAGEIAYLHKKGGSDAGLLALPIKGHREQKVNADVLEKDEDKDFGKGAVTVLRDSTEDEDLNAAIDQFVEQRYKNSKAKYADGLDMKKCIDAISDPNTYVQHAHDLLFGIGKMSSKEKSAKKIIEAMQNRNGKYSDIMDATMAVVKLAGQVSDKIMAKQGKLPSKPRVVFDKQKPTAEKWSVRFDDFTSLVDTLHNAGIADALNFDKLWTEKEIPLLGEVKKTFKSLRDDKLTKTEVLQKLHELEEKLGELIVTGF